VQQTVPQSTPGAHEATGDVPSTQVPSEQVVPSGQQVVPHKVPVGQVTFGIEHVPASHSAWLQQFPPQFTHGAPSHAVAPPGQHTPPPMQDAEVPQQPPGATWLDPAHAASPAWQEIGAAGSAPRMHFPPQPL
jgi:hypothetical protein